MAAHGFWIEAWRRYRRRPLAMAALGFVGFLMAVATFAPAIAGTKPVICRYKGRIYAPCLAYFDRRFEPAIFAKDKFRGTYPKNLAEKDPESWVIWPLFFQDPYRAVRADEWPGRPENPSMDKGVPSRLHPFGTDQAGVDVLAKMVHGTTVALLGGFVSMGIAGTIGILVGALGGYFGGWIDAVTSRVTEIVMCIPTLVLILAIVAIIEKPTIWHTMAIIGFTGWTGIARLTRGEFLRLKGAEYVTAARAAGAGPLRIMLRHILPNALAPILVPITFGIAAAILVESGLSFLGFGAPPPSASWGSILNGARSNLAMWWLVVFPGVAIFLTVLAYNLVGESGCGKSVTAMSILRLVAAPGVIESGSITLDSPAGPVDLVTLPEPKLRQVRGGRIGMIFQEPMTSLNPVFTVGDQIAEAVLLHKACGREEARTRALEMLRLVRLADPERRIDEYPHQLSGGMRQRVMIAMALACEPDLVIADEPTTALDVTIQAQILDLLADLRMRLGTAILLITHDLGVVAETCDDVAVMYAGRIVERARADVLFARPLHPYTIGLLAARPDLDTARGDRRTPLRTIPGMVPPPQAFPSDCRFHPRCAYARTKPIDGPACGMAVPELQEVEPGHFVRCHYATRLGEPHPADVEAAPA